MENAKENYVVYAYKGPDFLREGREDLPIEAMIYHLEKDKWYGQRDYCAYEGEDDYFIYVTPEGEVKEYLLIEWLLEDYYVIKYENEYNVFDFENKVLQPVEKLKPFLHNYKGSRWHAKSSRWYAIDKNDKLIPLYKIDRMVDSNNKLVKEIPFCYEEEQEFYDEEKDKVFHRVYSEWYAINDKDELIGPGTKLDILLALNPVIEETEEAPSTTEE